MCGFHSYQALKFWTSCSENVDGFLVLFGKSDLLPADPSHGSYTGGGAGVQGHLIKVNMEG